MKNHIAATATLVLILAPIARAEVIHVPADHSTIQGAIDVATDGDEVVVASGEYFERIDFLGKAITVRSADPTDPDVVQNTIINGGGDGRVVTCLTSEGPASVLSGLTITGGHDDWRGGGFYIVNASPMVTHCTFTHNHAYRGGGIAFAGGAPHLTDCTFTENTADWTGGAMYGEFSSPHLSNCTFDQNSSNFGGAIYFVTIGATTITGCTFTSNAAFPEESNPGHGGALSFYGGPLAVTDCIFDGNTAGGTGGGVSVPGAGGTFSFADCQFLENAAEGDGGALSFSGGAFTVTDCMFNGNTAGGAGGCVSVPPFGGTGSFVHCRFFENAAGLDGGAMDIPGSTAIVASYLCGNSGPQITGGGVGDPDTFVSETCDCNGNGVLDTIDVESGESLDCNDNSAPDECESDCNDNGVPDDCDTAEGTSLDCNGNGVPDECEIDCNDNGVPDDCDTTDGTSLDCNGNSIPDECEFDCNDNGVPDDCDIVSGVSLDCDANGVPDECETAPDCNDNGVSDFCDVAFGTSDDCNGNDIPDECDIDGGNDQNGDGIPDECQPVRNLTDGTYYFTIQPAIDAAQHGDEIMLLEGTYWEQIDLLGRAIVLRSREPEDSAVVAATVLRGGYGETITCALGEGPDTVISGLTIQHTENDSTVLGLMNIGSSPTVSNCVFIGAELNYGIGIVNAEGSNPHIGRCRITGYSGFISGAGMVNDASNPTLVDTIVCGNSSPQIAGPWTDGGGNIVAAECPSCVADIDGDNIVGFDDLLSVLSAWGACGARPEDVDNDGVVAFSDLLAVLSSWGPCV